MDASSGLWRRSSGLIEEKLRHGVGGGMLNMAVTLSMESYIFEFYGQDSSAALPVFWSIIYRFLSGCYCTFRVVT